MKLTNQRFLYLQVFAHLGLAYLLVAGTAIQILTSMSIAFFILLFSSTIMYHRYLSHKSWPAPRWFEVSSTILGIFSFTGSAVIRTLSHRHHHAFADTAKDPHSPRHNSIFRTYFPMIKENRYNLLLVKDLLSDKFHRSIHERYLIIIITTVVFSFLILGVNWTITLFVAPGCLCWMNISLCNIACHWGKETDAIKQSKLLAWLTFGEGYHKHHHDNPQDPNFGISKLDIGYQAIKLILFLDKINKPRTRI